MCSNTSIRHLRYVFSRAEKQKYKESPLLKLAQYMIDKTRNIYIANRSIIVHTYSAISDSVTPEVEGSDNDCALLVETESLPDFLYFDFNAVNLLKHLIKQ